MVRSLAGLFVALCCALAAGVNAVHARTDRGIVSGFVPVLIYHHVKNFEPGDDVIERGLTIPPKQFDSELSYLQFHRYHVITAQELVAGLRSRRRIGRRDVALTFDDGYADIYRNVYPELRKHRLRATFFVVPGLLSRPRYMTWSQVLDMSRHGMDIEAHTMTHPDLTVVSGARQWAEIDGSRRVLRTRLHTQVPLFAYPYGAYDSHVLRLVARAGYQAAFTTRQGWIARSNQAFTLPRVYVDNDDTLTIFAGRLAADPRVLAADPV